MISLKKFEERFEYLKLIEKVGEDTFGSFRYLNQRFYESKEWKAVRDQIIIRDKACDLADEDREIFGPIYIHHINPISKMDLLERSPILLDPNNLVCVTFETHNAIHYGSTSVPNIFSERKPNDTCPWRIKNYEQ